MIETENVEVVIAGGHGSCYDNETEVLTEDCWKLFSEVNNTDKIATLNSKGELEYQHPEAQFCFDYIGKMLKIDGRRINLLVTPNHKLYVRWLINQGKQYSPFQLIEAKNIGKKGLKRNSKGQFEATGTTAGRYLEFSRSAKWNCRQTTTFVLPSVIKYHPWMKEKIVPSKNIPIMDWLRFFGIWIAEGSTSLGKNGGKKGQYIISITQNNDKKRQIIKRWVEKLGKYVGFSCWEEKSNDHSKAIKFKNKQFYTYLKQFGHCKDKYIPKELKMLPPKMLRTLLKAMVLGDGYINTHGEIFYYTSSKKLADDVQEIALKIGKAANISRRANGVFTISIHEDIVGVTKRSMSWTKYAGKVYCVQVPNHIIYVRRQGKPCWCGNSTTFTGYEQQTVLQACQNDQVMTGTISHFLSCLVGQQLLPSIISKNGVFTIGYIVEFQFMVDTNFPVEQDPYAEPFKDCTVAIVAKILDGATLKQVWDAGIAKCDEWIAKLWNRPETDWAEVISCLENNRDGMIGLGDQEAYVMPPRRVALSASVALPALIGIGLLTLAERLP